MHKTIAKMISTARVRLSVNVFVDNFSRFAFWFGVVVLIAVLVERLIAVEILSFPFFISILTLVAFIYLLVCIVRIPSRKTVTVLIDKRLKLKERVSTYISLGDRDDPFAKAACLESRQKVEGMNVRDHFPILFPSRWTRPLGLWGLVVLILFLMPQYDLLGALQKQKQQQKQAFDVEVAKEQVKLTSSGIKLLVKQLGDESLSEDIDSLNANPEGLSPESIKRQAIKKLGSVSDRIKQLESGANKQSLEITKKMLKNLKPLSSPVSQKIQQSLAKGDFEKAHDLLKQMQKRMEQGQLSQEQKEQYASQFEDIARQLEKIAAQNKELEDLLKKTGLDKKTANLSDKEMRELLKKQGMTPEKIEQLMQKISACKSACNNCSGLGKALSACSSGSEALNPESLSRLASQLSDLDSFDKQAKMTQASIAEIENAIRCLGQGMCKSDMASKGPWKPGQSNKYGNGSGGPGRGTGEVDKDSDGNTSTKATKVANESSEGQVVASWYFKGDQIKGENSMKYTAIIKAVKENVAESINNNEIPKRYQESVKTYFSEIEEDL